MFCVNQSFIEVCPNFCAGFVQLNRWLRCLTSNCIYLIMVCIFSTTHMTISQLLPAGSSNYFMNHDIDTHRASVNQIFHIGLNTPDGVSRVWTTSVASLLSLLPFRSFTILFFANTCFDSGR